MATRYAGTKRKQYKNATEAKYPEETAKALELMGDPLKDFEAIAEASGLPRKTVHILAQRLRRRWVPVSNKISVINQKELLLKIEDRMDKALEYMDDVAFASAPLRDLALTFGILHDKRQLLMGQPTQILSVQERKELNELLPEIVKEAERRGITIDSSPVHAGGEEGVSTYVHHDNSPKIRTPEEKQIKRGKKPGQAVGGMNDRSTHEGQHRK